MTEAGASTLSSSVSLIKTIIGAGLLSMPLAFSTDGLILGWWIILLAGLTSGFGLFLQTYVSKYVPPGQATFFSICSITYPSLSVMFDIAIAVQCFGCAILYLVLIGDLMPTIVRNYANGKSWILASSIICVPLSFLKNLDSLKYTSILGLVAIAYMSLLVVGHYFVGDIARDYPEMKGPVTLWPQSLSAIFSTFSIIVFAFTGHQNMFSIINEAQNKSQASLSLLVFVAIIVSAVLFIVVGLAGYLTFGQNVSGNVIQMFPNGALATIGRSSIVFMVIFSFPLMLHPARISVNNIYFWLLQWLQARSEETTPLLAGEQAEVQNNDIENDRVAAAPVVPLSNNVFNVITTTLLIVGYTAAVTVKSFALVLALVGATGSTAISFILPGLFGYKLIGSGVSEPKQSEKILKFFSLLLVFWGFAVMILCLYTSLYL